MYGKGFKYLLQMCSIWTNRKFCCVVKIQHCLLPLQDLNELAAIVRGELPKLSRMILCALITIDVHARDMITGMVQSEVGPIFRSKGIPFCISVSSYFYPLRVSPLFRCHVSVLCLTLYHTIPTFNTSGKESF